MDANITLNCLSERADNVGPRVPTHQVGDNYGWLSNPNNAARFPPCTAAALQGKGICTLNGCDRWLSPPEGR
eukprot:11692100-Prorocentrum_lima.AAC.1